MSELKLRVCEIFGPTIQGEGENTGAFCLFIRLSGCDYNCKWCDTDHEDYTYLSSSFIIDELKRLGENVKRVVITGGNPLLQDIRSLVYDLVENDYLVEIETQGSVYNHFAELVRSCKYKNILLNVSLKGPSSEIETDTHTCLDNVVSFSRHGFKINLKFVINDVFELDWAIDKVAKLRKVLGTKRFDEVFNKVYFQPVNSKEEINIDSLKDLISNFFKDTRDDTVSQWMDKIRIGTQLHKIIWGGQRGV